MHERFWKEQPALLLALSLLVGTSSWVFACFWAVYLAWLRAWPGIVLMVCGSVYCWALYGGAVEGERGYFSIASVQAHQTPFRKGFLYKGMMYADGKRVPCTVLYLGEERPDANCDYVLTGKLTARGPYQYSFKANQWMKVEGTWSFAELRFGLKEKLRSFLQEKLKTGSFLSALITGEVEERSLRFEFAKLGLQHILAISGFHFAILIGFCSAFLSLFLSYRSRLIVLLVLVNGYFLFVGSQPAVQRSWLMAVLYLVGKLIGRQATGLNLVGVAMGVEILLDPLISGSLGFQLSFLCCWGILTFHPIIESKLRYLLPKRSEQEMAYLGRVSQHGYLVSSFLRQALSVSLAVNVVILPLLLYHFHQFPMLSLIYNLFFPFLVSGALFGLLISLVVYVVFQPLASICFWMTDLFTAQLLELASYPPVALDYSLKVPDFPGWIIPFYLFGLFCLTNRQSSGNILGFYGGRSSVG